MLKQGWYNKEITCNKYFPICSTVVICRVGCELMIGFKISIFLILTPALSRTLTFFLFLDLFNFFNFFNFNFLTYFFCSRMKRAGFKNGKRNCGEDLNFRSPDSLIILASRKR